MHAINTNRATNHVSVDYIIKTDQVHFFLNRGHKHPSGGTIIQVFKLVSPYIASCLMKTGVITQAIGKDMEINK